MIDTFELRLWAVKKLGNFLHRFGLITLALIFISGAAFAVEIPQAQLVPPYKTLTKGNVAVDITLDQVYNQITLNSSTRYYILRIHNDGGTALNIPSIVTRLNIHLDTAGNPSNYKFYQFEGYREVVDTFYNRTSYMTNWSAIPFSSLSVPAYTTKIIGVGFDIDKPFITGKFNISVNMNGNEFLLDPDISACGTISTVGTNTLTKSITGADTCITFGANNVYLDCNGFYITGTRKAASYGIYASVKSNVSIKNCTVINYENGLYFASATDSFISFSNFSNNSAFGILLQSKSSRTDVINVFLSYNNWNIYNHQSSFIMIANSTFVNYTTADMHMDVQPQNITFLNNSFTKSKITYGDCAVCNITYQWYARVNVTDGGVPVTADVNVSDKNGKSAYSGTISAGGLSPWIIVTDNITTKSGSTISGVFYNNYTINASYLNVFNTTSMNFSNRDFTVNLSTYMTYPTVVWLNQTPANISTVNVINAVLNITYNITVVSPAILNTTKIVLWHKTNTTSSDCSYFTNGTQTCGYVTTQAQKSNVSMNWTFGLQDNAIFPATYNFNQTYMEGTAKSIYSLINANHDFKIRLFNISSTATYGFFEVYANISAAAGTQPLSIYYCNSSYTTGNLQASPNCAQLATITSTQAFNHSHGVLSWHHVAPFAISGGKVNGISVSSTSYFVLKGGASSTWSVYYISNVSDANAMQTSTNNGIAWSNFAGTADAHLHQYDGTDKFWYFAEACDQASPILCTNSTIRSDLFDLGGLPPTPSSVYSPTLGSVYTNGTPVFIGYTASVSPNSYAISYYNITLRNPDTSLNLTILANNSNALFFMWDTTAIVAGSYLVGVEAKDALNQTSMGYSGLFSITLGEVCVINVTYVYNVTYVTNVTYVYNTTNITSGGGMTYLEVKPEVPAGSQFDFMMLGAGLLMGLAFAGLMVKEGFGRQ